MPTATTETALQTVKRVLDEAPDHVVAELWVDDRMTLGAFVDMRLADPAPPPRTRGSLNLADTIRLGIKDQGYGYTLKGDKLTVSSDEVFAIDIARLADFIRHTLATEGQAGIEANSAASLD